MRKTWILALGALAALSACRMGPNYARPGLATPPAYRGADGPATPQSFVDLGWWTSFRDDHLRSLLTEAVANNQDVAIAAARVQQSRSLVRVSRSELYPQVNGEVDASRTQASREIVRGGTRVQNDFFVGAPVSWEVDLWGRVRRSNEAAYARWLASEEARRDVLRILVADVAQAYVELRELDLELQIAKETVGTRSKTLDLFQKRLEGGAGSKLEVARASADKATADAAVPQLEQAIEQKENQISVLLGRLPGPIPRSGPLTPADAPPTVPSGLPSSLLERRPDVRAAEEELKAATADVGVATADLFPRLSLTGILGLESRDLSELASGDAAVWGIGAQLFGPIFDGGRRRGVLDAAYGRMCEARAFWVRSAQNAFRETSDALIAIRKVRDVRAADETRVKSLEEAVSLAWTRYDGGLSSYFEVLDAQRDLFPAQLAYAQTLRDQYVALVQLYRALGGGWGEAGLPPCSCTTECIPPVPPAILLPPACPGPGTCSPTPHAPLPPPTPAVVAPAVPLAPAPAAPPAKAAPSAAAPGATAAPK